MNSTITDKNGEQLPYVSHKKLTFCRARQVQELKQENLLQISLLKKQHAQELQHAQAQRDTLRTECEHLRKQLHLQQHDRVRTPA